MGFRVGSAFMGVGVGVGVGYRAWFFRAVGLKIQGQGFQRGSGFMKLYGLKLPQNSRIPL